MNIIDILIALVIPFVILVIIYSMGKKSKRTTGREPYVSGHKFPVMRIPYNPAWLYYISYFILWDIILLFILFTATGWITYPLVIASLAILIATMIAYPVRIRRVIQK